MQQNQNRYIKQLESRIKAFEEDRYCQKGCIEYQLDKIDMYRNYFAEIKESLIVLKSIYGESPKHIAKVNSINHMLELCNAALGGDRWV